MKIKMTSVLVDDQDKALDFYTNKLGFVKKQDLPAGDFKWLTVVSPHELDGTELLLEPNENAAAKTFQKAMYDQGIPLTGFAADALDTEYERLVEAGVTFKTKPTPMGSTRYATFEDTCGNLIQLYELVTRPDLSSRPHVGRAERTMAAPPHVIFEAWTSERFDKWFAVPGTVLMKPVVNSLFFFESEFDGARHPHYGRFLRLVPERLIEMTWITALGTQGNETVVTVELSPADGGTELKLTHSGFPDEAMADGHADGWNQGLEILDKAFPAEP